MIYDSFHDLVNSFTVRTSNALIFEDRKLPGKKGFLTYPVLACMIGSLEEKVKKSGQKTDFIRAVHAPETLIRIFADVSAGCSVVLLDPALPLLKEQAIRKMLEPRLMNVTEEEGRLVFFTSGTTSSSKAVVLSPLALLHASWRGQECLPIGEGDILLSILPLSHVFGFVCTMLWGLCYGASVALGRGVRHLLDDPKFFRPTVLPLVPTLAGAMTRFSCYNKELATILIGAAPLSGNELEALRKKTGGSVRIYTGYGLTETASGVAITEDPDDPCSLRVCPGVGLKLAEDHEILLKTDSLMDGYIELLPFVPNLVRRPEKDVDDEGFFHTGDIGIFDGNGRLHISGRKKDILVLPDGTKIFCPEYEKALQDSLGTEEVAVTVRKGRPVLLISNKVDAKKAEKIVEELNLKLSRSQQIAGIIYLDLPLPRTVTGKLKRWMIEKAVMKGDYSEWQK